MFSWDDTFLDAFMRPVWVEFQLRRSPPCVTGSGFDWSTRGGTSVGGIPEVIENGVNGLLVMPGEVDELREAIRRVLRRNDLRESFIEKGLHTIQDKFSYDSMVDRFESYLLETTPEFRRSQSD